MGQGLFEPRRICEPVSKLEFQTFEAIFLARTRAEWASVFAGSDACVEPVLTMAQGVP